MASLTSNCSRLRLFVLGLITSVAVLTNPAEAALDYSLVFDQSNYVASPSSSLTINVSLIEEATGGDVARLAPGGQDGLIETTFELDYGQTGLIDIGQVDIDDDVTVNPSLQLEFLDNVFSFNPTVGLIGVTGEADPFDFEDGLDGTELSPGVYQINIATFVFTVGDVEGVVDLALNPFSEAGDASPLALFLDDEPLVNLPTARITVTAIPEPGFLAFMGITTLGFVRRHKRRR